MLAVQFLNLLIVLDIFPRKIRVVEPREFRPKRPWEAAQPVEEQPIDSDAENKAGVERDAEHKDPLQDLNCREGSQGNEARDDSHDSGDVNPQQVIEILFNIDSAEYGYVKNHAKQGCRTRQIQQGAL